MKKILLLSLICCFLLPVKAFYFDVNDSITISLLTCSPGKEIYAKFGHTGIRVQDKIKNIDVVFNYGLFDFNTNNFYLKFIKGETDYQLGVVHTNHFLYEYHARNSSVWEQELNLTPEETERLIHELETNYLPENRVYRYNFVFDNCATRPRDKILSSLNHPVIYNYPYANQTFRELVGRYTGTDTWLKFGIDILLGAEADRAASRDASMFLPELLMNEFQYAVIKEGTQERDLTLPAAEIVEKTPETISQPSWFTQPLACTLYLLIITIALCYFNVTRHKHTILFDSILFIITGILGIIIFYLCFFSLHPLVKENYNLLWLNPLNIITGILVWFKPLRKPVLYLQLLNVLLILISMILFVVSLQQFNTAFFPLMMILFICSLTWLATELRKYKYNKRKI